ncbi:MULTISPECIES: helix-turn-helix domain-containing protein [unclassified Streptomyces]|uniref:helix-turn-helix domain-containing protein n=1 Tax=unclassified Streptomyces TaxID=2593676 RepID=UPI0036519988
MTEDRHAHTPQTFATWLREMMARRGYVERGSQGRFARDAGMPEGNLSRVLRGLPGLPDIRTTLTPIALALDVPLIEVLVRASVLSEDDVAALTNARLEPMPITTERAAAELGIKSPEGVAMFDRTVRGLLATEPPTPANSTTSDRDSG